MNERSFIVKSDLKRRVSIRGKATPFGCVPNTEYNGAKDALLRRKPGHSAQRDAPSYSTHLATVFRISSPTLVGQSVKQPEQVSLPGRIQRMGLASVAL